LRWITLLKWLFDGRDQGRYAGRAAPGCTEWTLGAQDIILPHQCGWSEMRAKAEVADGDAEGSGIAGRLEGRLGAD
jgi:hypothetical protein